MARDSGSRARRFWFATITLVAAACVSLVLVEFGLRGAERLPREHRSRLDYPDTWRSGGLGPGGSLKEGFRGEVVDGYGGTVRWANNSSGFRRDKETAPTPAPGVLRLLSIGDSFTAGYRVAQEETFSRRIERHLTREIGAAEVLIACVEDPPSGLDYLTRFGSDFQPHAVLMGITLGNDIAQSYLGIDPGGPYRLELERDRYEIAVNETTTLGFRHGLETLYVPDEFLESRSALARTMLRLDHARARQIVGESAWPIASWYGDVGRPHLFDPSHGLGFFLVTPPPSIEEGFARLERVLTAVDLFSREQDIDFVVILFPQRFQVQRDDWRQTIVKYGLKESAFDLRAPNRRIFSFCRRRGVACIDPTDAMRRRHEREGRSLYLRRGDMHWNALGHEALYEAVIPGILDLVAARPDAGLQASRIGGAPVAPRR